MKIYINTILGSPAAECAHFGICKVDELHAEDWDAFQPRHNRHVKAILSLSSEPGRLRFEFPFSGMRRHTRKAFFSPAGFRVDSSGYLPKHLAVAMGIEEKIILPGLYPIVFSDESVVVEVEIRKELLAPQMVDIDSNRIQVLKSGTCSNQGVMTKRIARFYSMRL